MNIRFVIKKHLQGGDYTGHVEVNDQLLSGLVGYGKTQKETLDDTKSLFEVRLLFGLKNNLKPIEPENRNIVGFIHKYTLDIKPNTLSKYKLQLGISDEPTNELTIEADDQDTAVIQVRQEYPYHKIFSVLKV